MSFAVTGGNAGVGTSTVAVNLAAELDAIVVDTDLGVADLPPRQGPDLHDVLAGRAEILEAVSEAGPVTILPDGHSLSGARAADGVDLTGALEGVERAYGRVVVDYPAGLRSDVDVPPAIATAYVLVTQPPSRH